MDTIKALFIDNAGVLYQTDWQRQFSLILNRPVAVDELHQVWASLRCIELFECGKIDQAEFFAQLKLESQSSLNTEQLKRHFQAILTEPFANAAATLKALKKHYRLYLLCNSNQNHWQTHIETSGYLSLFDGIIASQQLGVMKPEPRFFQQALHIAQLSANEVRFFDDGQLNVAAAKKLGMQAQLVTNPEAIWQWHLNNSMLSPC